jgi:hypothetical protein
MDVEIRSVEFDVCRDWISKARDAGYSWDQIFLCRKNSVDELEDYLEHQKTENFWPISLDAKAWREIVAIEQSNESKKIELEDYYESMMLTDYDVQSSFSIPKNPRSSWQLYKKHLQDNDFNDESVMNIEISSYKLLKRLSLSTVSGSAIKGLVIGNVQSGKTANMAGLMSMAADHGFNIFIILSGTIENLRKQTQSRLLRDLNHPGNLNWIGLEHLSRRSPHGQRPIDIRLEPTAGLRYMTICLKNKSRLHNLLDWLYLEPNKTKQMKIIVIDDEADQASVNTGNIEKNERRAINKAIVNLVEGKDKKGKDVSHHFQAMNYISYTATPYANFLNESSPESLYPRSFVMALNQSREYFGPQQIFGNFEEETDYNLDIIRLIDESQVRVDDQQMLKIYKNESIDLPYSLKKAICWFLISVCSMRISGHKKPISMLIHTSSKIEHHETLARAIEFWIKNTNTTEIIDICKETHAFETSRFTKQDLKKSFPNYGIEITHIPDYLPFSKIQADIIELIQRITAIELDEDLEVVYHTGIHLCIDNSNNNGISDEMTIRRLIYPDSTNPNHKLGFAPAFIVVGGNTLSRGLTIEGLISTYFSRKVLQADTLMQMGRWFGFRRFYEMYPRIWMLSSTLEKFNFLTSLDTELREEIRRFHLLNIDPSRYGPMVKNTPKASWLMITSKRKMQRAQEVEMDYSGTNTETLVFDNHIDKLENNFNVTMDFLGKLPGGHSSIHTHAYVWNHIDFNTINSLLLSKMKFSNQGRVFDDLEAFRQWMSKVTSEGVLNSWNVAVAGRKNPESGIWFVKDSIKIGKISRNRVKSTNVSNSIIRIGVLRDPKDLIADVDIHLNELSNSALKILRENKTSSQYSYLRNENGFEKTPLLLIYLIDKDSKPKESSVNREPLNAIHDIVGLSLIIPGSRNSVSLAKKLQVKIDSGFIKENKDADDED